MTFNTVLLRALHLTFIAPLGFRSAFSSCYTPLRVRNPRTLLPFLEHELLTDATIVSLASMAGNCLILRLRPPNITKTYVLWTVLDLLDMHHLQGKVDIIMEHH